VTADWRRDRVGSALRDDNPLVMARMRSGFAVIGDTQHLPGYSLLLTDDPMVDHLTDLDWERRKQFLFDLSLIGEAVQRACREGGLRRINYEVLGNSIPVLTATPTPATTGNRKTGSRGRSGAIQGRTATLQSSSTSTRSTASCARRSLPSSRR
jgi:hypothetical protein